MRDWDADDTQRDHPLHGISAKRQQYAKVTERLDPIDADVHAGIPFLCEAIGHQLVRHLSAPVLF
jgi:hypothetical protein